jgi:predicted heme/steroid binding protein
MNDNLQVALEKIDTKFNSLIDVNIYVSNGTITSNRTVTLNGKTLSFVGSSYTTIFQPAGTLQLGSLAGVGNRMVIADTNGVLGTQAIPLGTVTSVDMSVPTGFAISGNPITTAGTLALAFASGYSLPTNASQSNWNTAYNWVSNFPALVAGQYLTNNGTTLSWAAIDLSGYVPTARTLTINGTSYDLTANRSWSVGTVTSIVASTGITGGTITSSGTVAFDTTWGDARYQAIGSYVVTSRTLTINGTTYDLSADRTWSVGTVTSVAALTLGTTGTDVSSTVATGTTTPVITLNIPTASATNRGALSSTDWTTFNNKYNLPALTSGSVLFSNGTTIAQDNSNFFWDNTNKRLGIGIGAPTVPLHIRANDNNFFNQLLIENINTGANSITYMLFRNGTTTGGGIAYYGANYNNTQQRNSLITFTNAGNKLGFVANAEGAGANQDIYFATKLSNTNLTIFSTGNVLIQNSGTHTDAGFRLDVNGTTRLQGATTVNGTLTTTGEIRSTSVTSGNVLSLYGNATSHSGIQIGGVGLDQSPYINLYANGGTTTSINFSRQNSPGVLFKITQNYTGLINQNPSFLGIGVNGDTIKIVGNTGNVLINQNSDAGYRLDVNGTMRVSGSTTFGTLGTGTGMYWDNTNNKLGIGTSTPTFSISAVTNANTTSALEIINNSTGTAANAGVVVRNSTHSAQLFKLSTGYSTYKTLLANDLGFYNVGAGDISVLNDFSTGNIKFAAGGSSTAHLTIFSNGNVGINQNTDAGFRLDVNGTGRFASTLLATNAFTLNSSAASDALQTFSLNGAAKWRIGNAYVAGANYFQLYDSVSSLERIRWNNNSTATFTSDFTFVGGSNAVATFQAAQPDVKIQATGGSNAVSLSFAPSSGYEGVIQNTATNGFIQVKTASTIRVTFKNGGQVNFQPLAADPAGAGAGDVYYNSGTNKLRLYDGTSWVDLN